MADASPDPYPRRVSISATQLVSGDGIPDSRVVSALLMLDRDAGLGVSPGRHRRGAEAEAPQPKAKARPGKRRPEA